MPALLRLGPVPALLASGAATSAYFALGYTDGPVYLALPDGHALVAAWSARVRDWIWPAAIAVASVCAALAARAELYDDIERSSPWQGIGIVAIVAAAGAAATALRARQEASRDRTQRAATEERLRMAQDLHDGVGHGLAVIAMQAGAALHVLDKDPAKAQGEPRGDPRHQQGVAGLAALRAGPDVRRRRARAGRLPGSTTSTACSTGSAAAGWSWTARAASTACPSR